MAKYRDKSNCKDEPRIMRTIRGESAKDRHYRRLQTNKEHQDKFKAWAEADKNIEYRILNNGEHWQVKTAGKQFDWWPRSAKLIIDCQWKKGIHCHDYTQFIKVIEEKI